MVGYDSHPHVKLLNACEECTETDPSTACLHLDVVTKLWTSFTEAKLGK